MTHEVFLVTGASGCIGSWVLRHLLDRGIKTIATDIGDNKQRPGLLIADEDLRNLEWQNVDVTDTQAVNEAVASNKVTHVVHLAGLQIPFAKANPPLGAAVNVVGTVNILEAVRHNAVKGLSYASSVAVFGPAERYPETRLPDEAPRLPETLYGIYKVADEDSAQIYWQDWQIRSVGLRPGVVFGVGRDQGLTSDISKAILAVAAGQPFNIRFDGLITMQHAGDVANMFIDCALSDHAGSVVCNLRNDVIEVSEFIRILSEHFPESRISFDEGKPLPFPADYDDANLQSVLGNVPHTPLVDAVKDDIERYRRLLHEGKIDLSILA